jgi:membrane protease YdiL (CAAX protease family)
VALVGAYNVVGNLWLPHWAYVPANLAFGAVLVALARRLGASWDQLGLDPSNAGRGARLGLVAVALVAAAVALGPVLSPTRTLLLDERVGGVTVGYAAYQMLVRIPLGTAVFEELVFRGVLLGLFLRRVSPLAAATASSALFGLWHLLPAAAGLERNPAGEQVGTGPWLAVALAAAVATTWLAGYGFCWLRLRGRSLLAPILAHTATNSFAYLAAFLLLRGG